MEEYVSNSHLSRDPIDVTSRVRDAGPEKDKPIRPESVVQGKVKVRKKSGLKKMAEKFIAEDAKHVRDYIVDDVLIPALKKGVSDVICNSVDMFLYGETGHTKRYSSPSSRVSYRSYYDDRRDDRRTSRYTERRDFDFDEILMSHDDAQEVLARMDETLETYGTVSVLDYYDFCGISGSQFTDAKYGWTDLRTAGIARCRDGWVIKLPKAIPID